MSLSVVATLVVKPEHRAEVIAALTPLVAASRAEAGCRRYLPHEDAADAARLVVVEEWESDAALEQHLAAPHFKSFGAAIAGKVESVDIRRLRPLD